MMSLLIHILCLIAMALFIVAMNLCSGLNSPVSGWVFITSLIGIIMTGVLWLVHMYISD